MQVCDVPSCGQSFSQQGNLKVSTARCPATTHLLTSLVQTHKRRHTGEKPFECERCHKRFAQRGNVRAHMLTHDEARKFHCLLDDCGKTFTQLGNLKVSSHPSGFCYVFLTNGPVPSKQISRLDPSQPHPTLLADRREWTCQPCRPHSVGVFCRPLQEQQQGYQRAWEGSSHLDKESARLHGACIS